MTVDGQTKKEAIQKHGTSCDAAPSAHSPSPTNPAPDGGLAAWLQVLMGHLVLINGWGYLTSFGLFQSYYITELAISQSSISWIGSIQIFLVYFIGTFSGKALDIGYYHAVLNTGLALQVFAIFMTSISTRYWQLLLAQGLCKGIGDGLVFCPTVALVATYFSTRRSLAMACTASGGATGGIIFPLIARQLLPHVGFGWTVRVMGFVVLFNAIVIAGMARVRIPPSKTAAFLDLAAFKDLSYVLFCVGMFFNLWAVYFCYFYISVFAKTVIHVSAETSMTILLSMNAIGVPGRLACGLAADRLFGPVNTLIPVVLSAGCLLYIWIAVHTLRGLFAFCLVYGFFAAGVQSLFPAACASLSADLSKIGIRTGMCFSLVSIACLTGPPIAGALVELRGGSFLYTQLFGGSSFIFGSLSLLLARLASKDGLNMKKRM